MDNDKVAALIIDHFTLLINTIYSSNDVNGKPLSHLQSTFEDVGELNEIRLRIITKIIGEQGVG